MSQKRMPDNSPFIASNLACRGCGDIMEPEIILNARGMAEVVRYTHRNEKVGCAYMIESTVMLAAEMKPLREDGTVAQR